ncbi:extracellular solute-binding protein [Paenibacillus thalictri]|uniref:extracellular solute-binding protein n=1 Tax=Paenibacillus thalictri TaxID=2527873 RepID=UPI0013EF36B0|nr:extracellular solute-binding protein [Paenibacillus thalictri]
MKKIKRLNTIGSCSVAALLALSVAACSSGTPDKPSAAQPQTPAPQQPEKKETAAPPQPVTYKIFRNFGAPEYPADGGKGHKEVLAGLEKAGLKGIDYQVNLASGTEYFTKLNLLASSGDLPDFFNVDIPTLTRFADEGLIMPLDDLLKNAPNVGKLVISKDLDALKYKGKQYGLPVGYRPEAFNGPDVSGFNVRQDWLDNLGLKQPKTLDEFYNVLKAFTNDDPDKNGKKDTYGLGAAKPSNPQNTTFAAIFGAYGIIPNFWHERDGQLKQGMVLPESKEVLALLQKWFKEGLIDPEFVITEQKQLDEKVVGSKVGIFEGNAFNVDPKQPVNLALKKATPTANVQLLAPPSGAGGKNGWPENMPAYNDIRAISAKAKNPEQLMKLIDWSASDAGFPLVTYGVENEHYTFDKAKNRINMTVNSYSDLYAQGFSNPIRFIQVVDRRWMVDEALTAMETANKYTVKNQFWSTTQAMLDYPDLPKLWSEYYAKIVTGTWPVDKWDEFVTKYYSQGGKEIEKQVNEEWKKTKK